MDVDFIFKIAAIGIIIAILNTLLIRSGREDQAMLTTLAGVIVVLMCLFLRSAICFPASNQCLTYDAGVRYCRCLPFACGVFKKPE